MTTLLPRAVAAGGAATLDEPAGLLDSIAGPADLRGMDAAKLTRLAAEIRSFLLDSVRTTGGHLGPNLGVVELTIALHRVFDSPRDVILWDTGHQAYVHKLLTGRRGEFARLRQSGGLSGYPSRAESEHDVIENSHASTALSYADGLAKAFHLSGSDDRAVVAVVGDGALTGGMCWEALNNIGGAPHRPVVIVINDNGRSYGPTVGGIADHLAALRASAPGTAATASVFARLGLDYLGPVDGHDREALELALRQARKRGRPVAVHCLTRKGMGHAAAEQDDADRMHALPAPAPAGRPASAVHTPTWTDAFGVAMVEQGARRPDVVAITAAMLLPVGLGRFARAYPDRAFDVGIAEQHAVASAAGLALGGLHPVVAVYATFLNRALDQALMDVTMHGLGVTFVLDRAGITGEDGPSHNGMWDLSVLQPLPGVRIAAPRDVATLRAELDEALDVRDGPTVLRFPKSQAGPDLPAIDTVGGVDLLRQDAGAEILIVSVGAMAEACLGAANRLAARGLPTTVVDPRWVVPANPVLAGMAAGYRLVVVVEDGIEVGGVGAAVERLLRRHRVTTDLQVCGIPPRFHPAAKRAELLDRLGLTADALADRIAASYPGRRRCRPRSRRRRG